MRRLPKSTPEWLSWDIHHFDSPAANFPGDDDVSISYSDALNYDPKGKGYPTQTIQGMLKIAQNFGAEIDLATYERTKRMVVAPEAADPYIDGGDNALERRRRFGVLTDSIPQLFNPDIRLGSIAILGQLHDEDPLLAAAMAYWGNSVRAIPEQLRQPIEHHALETLRASLRKAEAPNLRSYAQEGCSEGRNYALMWVHTIWSGQAANKTRDMERFARWTTKGVRAMTLLDSAVDLKKDYKEGNVQFEPTTLGRLALLAMSARDLPAIVLPGLKWKIEALLASYSFERGR